MPSDFILDTVALRVMTFAHQDGLTILLNTLLVSRLYCPREVYDHDEHSIPLHVTDEDLSELARGLRFAERQASGSTPAPRYQAWLANAAQLSRLLTSGALVIETLTLDEVARRDDFMTAYGIGAGEAACLVLMERDETRGVFVSSDRIACRVANQLELPYITIEDILAHWISNARPTLPEFDAMIDGMRASRYAVSDHVLSHLRALL